MRRRLTGVGFGRLVASAAHRMTRTLVSRTRLLGAFAFPAFLSFPALAPHVPSIDVKHLQRLLCHMSDVHLPYVPQVAIRAVVVQTIADCEHVRYFEPRVGDLQVVDPARWLVQQRAHFNRRSSQISQVL